MPKLPDASALSGVNIGAPRSFVDLPVPDIAGASNAMARGIAEVGQGISVFAEERRKKASAQERFDTKMRLLKAEDAYAEATRDLDPLDPEYVEKKRARRREIFAPILSSVRDPENRQYFDLSTEEDYVRIGIRAGEEHKAARGKKQALDLDTYVDGVRKRVRDKTYTGDPIADITQMINDSTDIDEVTRQEILPKYISSLTGDQLETEFETIVSGGTSVTPSVRSAVAKAVASAGPDAPAYLEEYLLRTATIESRGGRAKTNPRNPNVGGTWQIDIKTAPELGLSPEDRFDDEKSAVGITKKAITDYKKLKADLDREPTPAELYLLQQQGIGGGPKLLANPDKKAVDVVGRKAVSQNLPDSMQHLTDKLTAKQFAQHVMNYYGGNSGGGMIDPNETLETLRLTDSYQRMSADDQARAEDTFLKRIEKQNKEAEAAAKIELQRDTVDYAVSQFDDPAKGEAYIKSTITDPDTREDALTMFRKEQDQIAENARRRREKIYNDTYDAVNAALDEGNVAEAQRIVSTADITGEERDKLKDRIAKGEARQDDPQVYDGLVALKIGNETEQRYFANIDGNGLNLSHLRHVLKPSTVEALVKEQEAFRKRFEKTGKIPTYDSAGQMLDLRLRAMGVEVGDKAPAADIRFKETMRAIMTRNTEAALERNGGRDLTPSQLEEILDQTFMEFRGKKQGWFRTTDETLTARDVYDRIGEKAGDYDLLPDYVMEQAIAGIEAVNKPITPENLNRWLRSALDSGWFEQQKQLQNKQGDEAQ